MKARPRYIIDSSSLRKPPIGIDVSLGKRDFGKARVDCAFLYKETTWGRIQERPLGILHIQLTFTQPLGYKLRQAIVVLTFEEARAVLRPLGFDERPLYVTNHVAPEILCGLPIESARSRERRFMPELGAEGLFTVGGMGVADTKDYQQRHRWEFRTVRSCSDSSPGIYDQAQCLWTANPLNHQVDLIGPMRAAIAVEHKKEPFVVKLGIQGELSSGVKRFMYSLQADSPPIQTVISPLPAEADISSHLLQLKETLKTANGAEIPGK
jgi:hypothetical protein